MAKFLRVAVPLAVIFVLGFIFEFRAQVGADEARFLTQETAVIERAMRQVEREVETATGDLLFVADLVAGAIGRESAAQRAALEQGLLALVRRRPDYVQVRFLAADGREVVRVERSADGPRIVPASALQDKSKRDYFVQTLRLGEGEILISPMELNVERGVPQRPFVPVVRLSTPLQDEAGQTRGIVVLNTHGSRFLRAFKPSPEKSGVQRMIVNADGYWLRHRPEVEWGFMLEHRSGFQRAFPEIWAGMKADGRGQAESSEGLFFFDTVSLRTAPGESDAGDAPPVSWLLISWVPREVLDTITIPVATRLLVRAVPLLFGLLALSLLLAAALEKKRLTEEALRSLDRVRSVMMTAALDAIVVMDESGITQEFNPSAQQMFGYTLDEARGQHVADLIIPPRYREAHQEGLRHYLATGEGPIIDKHIDDLMGMRKSGEEFPLELTVCTVTVAGDHLFFGFLRDLGEPASGSGEADAEEASDEDQGPNVL
jgi:PAS domain S-box-containing protein